MKKFEDLIFIENKARLYFPNGYGISVVTEDVNSDLRLLYIDEKNPFEIAIVTSDGKLCYNTPISNDVIGYCNKEKVNKIMKEIQELSPLDKGE